MDEDIEYSDDILPDNNNAMENAGQLNEQILKFNRKFNKMYHSLRGDVQEFRTNQDGERVLKWVKDPSKEIVGDRFLTEFIELLSSIVGESSAVGKISKAERDGIVYNTLRTLIDLMAKSNIQQNKYRLIFQDAKNVIYMFMTLVENGHFANYSSSLAGGHQFKYEPPKQENKGVFGFLR